MITVQLIPNLLLEAKFICEIDMHVLITHEIMAFHNSISAN